MPSVNCHYYPDELESAAVYWKDIISHVLSLIFVPAWLHTEENQKLSLSGN